MSLSLYTITENEVSGFPAASDVPQQIMAEALTENDRDEILKFLSVRPLHTVIMAGWIYDHGVISPRHRGLFFGCRNAFGELEGVGLIGRTTIFEARTTRAAAALGKAARRFSTVQTVFAEPEPLEAFWNSYADRALRPRLKCHELLYQCRTPSCAIDETENLRPATMAEIDQIEAAHAEMVKEETGIDPLQQDREGFRMRCAERIEANRVWISMHEGQLAFKVDVITQTPSVTYFEGLWVNPELRGRGLGRCFLGRLTKTILSEGRTACFFVNPSNRAASRFYPRLGCKPVASYVKYCL